MARDKTFENSNDIVPRLSLNQMNERTMHYHEHVELMIITRGSVTVEIEDDRRRVSAGEGVLLFPYVAHSYQEATKDCSRFCLVFNPSYFGELKEIFSSYKPKKGFFSQEQWRPFLNGDAEEVLTELCFATDDSDRFVRAQGDVRVLSFLFDILRVCGVESESSQDKIYRAAISYCLENFKDAQLCVSDVAKAMGISRATLCRLFAERHGGVKTYINRVRVDYARYLLENTDLRISQIAERSGFAEESTFYRAYRRMFGVAPSKRCT